MKRHVNRTCFHADLKYQTGMSSFHLSSERTLGQQNRFSYQSVVATPVAEFDLVKSNVVIMLKVL